jgi:hypothetical protein
MGCERLQPILSQDVYKYAMQLQDISASNVCQWLTSAGQGYIKVFFVPIQASLLESSLPTAAKKDFYAEKVSLESLSYGSFDDDTRRQDSRRVE